LSAKKDAWPCRISVRTLMGILALKVPVKADVTIVSK